MALTLKLKPAAEAGNIPGDPEPDTSSSLEEASLEEDVALGAEAPVDTVTGSDEALSEVAEYGAEKV